MNAKQRFKNLFKGVGASDEALELVKRYLLPFARQYTADSVDTVVRAFFAAEDRKIVEVRACRAFKMPGKYYIAGNRPVYGYGPRYIKQWQRMTMVVDRKDNTAKVQTVIDGKDRNFLLEKFELETIKDWIEVR